jgi:hypothetical protein
VSVDGGEYVVHGGASTDTIAAIARIAEGYAVSVIDVHAGTQRLETLFRRFTERPNT